MDSVAINDPHSKRGEVLEEVGRTGECDEPKEFCKLWEGPKAQVGFSKHYAPAKAKVFREVLRGVIRMRCIRTLALCFRIQASALRLPTIDQTIRFVHRYASAFSATNQQNARVLITVQKVPSQSQIFEEYLTTNTVRASDTINCYERRFC